MVKTNKIHYFLDMDGVLCDHNKQADEYGVKIPKNTNSDAGIEYDISEYKDGFFESMAPMPDLHLFQDWLKWIERDRVHILTAVPKRRTSALSVFDEKKEWIKEYFDFIPSRNIHIVFREHKQFFAKEYPHAILIDDNKNNINEWRASGGIGILHQNALKSIKRAMAIHEAIGDLI
tara:strand:+ start:164 stop:691 length:528 start_codon:yes stop_codon:yes gene_type:complete